MAKYSKASADKLATCHPDLQTVFALVLKDFDHTIIEGHRTDKRQKALYAQGRTTAGQIVTQIDGVNKKSMHQSLPSMAVDAIPFPIDWKDTDRMRYFAGHVVQAANMLYSLGVIEHKVRHGGDWDSDTDLNDQSFIDLPHYELYKPK